MRFIVLVNDSNAFNSLHLHTLHTRARSPNHKLLKKRNDIHIFRILSLNIKENKTFVTCEYKLYFYRMIFIVISFKKFEKFKCTQVSIFVLYLYPNMHTFRIKSIGANELKRIDFRFLFTVTSKIECVFIQSCQVKIVRQTRTHIEIKTQYTLY